MRWGGKMGGVGIFLASGGKNICVGREKVFRPDAEIKVGAGGEVNETIAKNEQMVKYINKKRNFL